MREKKRERKSENESEREFSDGERIKPEGFHFSANHPIIILSLSLSS